MPTTTLQHELRKRRPFDLPAEETFLNLQRTCAMLAGPFETLFREHSLSAATYNILRILRGELEVGENKRGLPCQDVGERMVTRVPDVTRLVDRLETAKLVQRERCTEDRRVVYISITRQGLKVLEQLDSPVRAMHTSQLKHMSDKELDQLNRLLVKARSPIDRTDSD